MPVLPAQNDILSGIQLDALASVTSVQLLQAINNATPISNIGYILRFSGGGGTTWPDTTGKHARYLWLDTYTTPAQLKAWNGAGNAYTDWVNFGLTADSISETHIPPIAVALFADNGTTPKICIKTNAPGALVVPDGAKANYVLKMDSSGAYVELVAISALFSNGVVPLAGLAPGADKYFLRMSGAAWAAEQINFANEITDATLGIIKLNGQGQTPYAILRINAGGSKFELIPYNTEDIVANRTLPLTKLAPTGASVGHIPRFDGNDWVAVAPLFNLSGTVAELTMQLLSIATSGDIPHGLGGKPIGLRAVVVMTSADVAPDYAIGDELEISGLSINSGGQNNGIDPIAVGSEGTNIFSSVYQYDNIYIPHRVTGNWTLLTKTSWTLKVYAWR